MIKSKLILIGAGGHCKSVIDALKDNSVYEIFGILDAFAAKDTFYGIDVFGDDSLAEAFIAKGYHFLIVFGNVGKADKRVEMYNNLKTLGANFANPQALNASVSHSAVIGQGTIIMQNAIVNAEAVIGENCIINTNALIEHETVVGNHVHVATSVTINGQCTIGDRTFIGSGAVVANNITIVDDVIIGAGAIVIKNIEEPGVYVGNPCKKVNHV